MKEITNIDAKSPGEIYKNYRSNIVHQVEKLKSLSPLLYDTVDLSRLTEDIFSRLHVENALLGSDFDGEAQGGRGQSYNKAQRNLSVRLTGIRQLFAFASPDENLQKLSPNYKILDALGGDGVLTRAISMLEPSFCMPAILTSDLSQYMVLAAQAHCLPSLQQPAQYLLLKEASLHAVIIAYGSHHIPVHQRLQVCQEALRVLKPGGHIVLYDFEQLSPVAFWFQHIVHPYSLTGHDCPHFTPQEMHEYLSLAGFRDVRVQYMYDPFVLWADTQKQVKYDLASYLSHMYGLTKLMEIHDEHTLQEAVYDLALQYFYYDYQSMGLPLSFGVPHIHIEQRENRWYLEMPRVALVGRARKE